MFSCKTNDTSTEVEKVMSFMIDEKATPLIPPPPINDTVTTTVSKMVIDSLRKIKLKIGLYPVLDNISNNEIKTSIDKESQDVFFKNTNTIQKEFNLDKIHSKKGHQIILADTTEIKRLKDFENFDILFRFSNFHFSKNKQKVFFSLGISRSHLAGSSANYILKKDNNNWVIEYSKKTSIW